MSLNIVKVNINNEWLVFFIFCFVCLIVVVVVFVWDVEVVCWLIYMLENEFRKKKLNWMKLVWFGKYFNFFFFIFDFVCLGFCVLFVEVVGLVVMYYVCYIYYILLVCFCVLLFVSVCRFGV